MLPFHNNTSERSATEVITMKITYVPVDNSIVEWADKAAILKR